MRHVFGLSGEVDVEGAALDILTRHPMREDELCRALERTGRCSQGAADAVLGELLSFGRAQVVVRQGARFLRGTGRSVI